MTPVAYGYEARYLLSEWSVDRFWSKVDTSDECWLWMGTTSKGYGRHHDSGTWHPAHRIAYELLVGPVPEGLTLDHLCRVRNCVNPAHLEPVTTRENVMRGVSVAAQNARKTHCKHGHPFEGENVLYLNGGRFRHCRPCHARRSRERRFRLRLRRLEERQANAGTDGTVGVRLSLLERAPVTPPSSGGVLDLMTTEAGANHCPVTRARLQKGL